MNPTEVLLSIRDLVKDDPKVYHSYYLEFQRRLLVLRLVEKYCPKGSLILDLGAQPFILSCALKRMGYKVVSYDYDPEPYMEIAKACGVEVVRCDLEKDHLDVNEAADCVVFTEVLEHLNPYYVGHTLTEINKVLRHRGRLILTTPNIASLFRRLRLLIGRQPQYKLHVHEYTKDEVEDLLRKYGFCIIDSHYSDVNDLSFIDRDENDYLKANSFAYLLRVLVKHPTRLNLLRALAYPLLKIVPSLRMLIVIVAEKCGGSEPMVVNRW